MNQNDVNALKVEAAQKGLQIFIDNLVKTEEHVLFLKHRLQALSKKSKPSEDEKKQKTEIEADIKRFTEGVEDTKVHIEIIRSIIEKYSNNIPVDL